MSRTNEGEYVSIDASSWLPTPDKPWDLVVNRFDKTLGLAESMTDLLIGPQGDAGYLGVLAELLEDSAPVTDIESTTVDTSMIIAPVKTPPTFDKNDLETYPIFNKPDPELQTIPTVDISDLAPPEQPGDINPVISWSEIAINADVYQPLLARVLNDLTDGATGLAPDVLEANYELGLDKQRRENDKAYQKVQNDISGRGSTLPTGALLSAIGELAAEVLEQNSNYVRMQTVENAELAQKNSQFIIEMAYKLEALFRDTRDNESNRSLDYHKAVAALVIQTYVEKVKMYIAIADANKMYVEVQVANLKAIVEYNNGLISEYKAFLEAYGIQVEATANKNSSLSDVYKAEVSGYDSETKAITGVDQIKLDKIKVDLGNAELVLRTSIANAENILGGYSTEASLKEKISNDMAGLANQTIVGSLSSVNANASLGYSSSESQSESWGHSDSLSESHGFQHDPES